VQLNGTNVSERRAETGRALRTLFRRCGVQRREQPRALFEREALLARGPVARALRGLKHQDARRARLVPVQRRSLAQHQLARVDGLDEPHDGELPGLRLRDGRDARRKLIAERRRSLFGAREV
jgi:hypothetical protein